MPTASIRSRTRRKNSRVEWGRRTYDMSAMTQFPICLVLMAALCLDQAAYAQYVQPGASRLAPQSPQPPPPPTIEVPKVPQFTRHCATTTSRFRAIRSVTASQGASPTPRLRVWARLIAALITQLRQPHSSAFWPDPDDRSVIWLITRIEKTACANCSMNRRPVPARSARRRCGAPRGPQRKRFYKEAGVAEAEGGFAVTLDGKPIRTPSGRQVVAPTARHRRADRRRMGGAGRDTSIP